MDEQSISAPVQRLASERCVPCKDAKPFSIDEAAGRLKPFDGWSLQSGPIQKEFHFESYLDGLEFAYSLGKIGELENHHPDLFVGWRRVRVEWSTHAIRGLSQNDFIMAAKSELEYSRIMGH